MLPCELAEEHHEESDGSLRTKFVTSKISCAVDVACLRNPRIGLSFQCSRIVLQNRQRPKRRGFSVLRHVKKVKQKRYHDSTLRTEIRARSVCLCLPLTTQCEQQRVLIDICDTCLEIAFCDGIPAFAYCRGGRTTRGDMCRYYSPGLFDPFIHRRVV